VAILMNQASVGTTATFVGSIPPAGYFMASGGTAVFLGNGSAVTVSTGFQVSSSAPLVWQNTLAGPAVPVYAIASSTASTLSYSFGNGPAGQVIAGGTAALQLNHNAALIQPVGVAGTAGSSGLAADAGHVHTGLSRVAATSAAGYALINGAGNIISWTAPNDGLLHRFAVYGNFWVAVNGVGGQVNANFTDPGGNAQSRDLQDTYGGAPDFVDMYVHGFWLCQANTTVTVRQISALTSGTVTLYAELWAS
jgi:hypothetical protein